MFKDALHSDISDTQGGTTAEGIYLGAMAGTVDLLQRFFAGLELREGHLWFNPSQPDELELALPAALSSMTVISSSFVFAKTRELTGDTTTTDPRSQRT